MIKKQLRTINKDCFQVNINAYEMYIYFFKDDRENREREKREAEERRRKLEEEEGNNYTHIFTRY